MHIYLYIHLPITFKLGNWHTVINNELADRYFHVGYSSWVIYLCSALCTLKPKKPLKNSKNLGFYQPCSYHLATCTLQACDAETNSKVAENHNYHSTTMSARAAVNKYNPVSYFCISAALLTTLTKLPISKTDCVITWPMT